MVPEDHSRYGTLGGELDWTHWRKHPQYWTAEQEREEGRGGEKRDVLSSWDGEGWVNRMTRGGRTGLGEEGELRPFCCAHNFLIMGE